MKAAVYYQNGGPEVFKYEDIQDPICKANEVLIKIRSISIEGGDLINREMRPLINVPNDVSHQTRAAPSHRGQMVYLSLI